MRVFAKIFICFKFLFILINQVFAGTLTTFAFRFRIISVKLFVFEANIVLETNTKVLIITELRNKNFIEILHITLYRHQ